jgi:two-component system response regulator QseB
VKVLVVDDERAVRESLDRALRLSGYEVARRLRREDNDLPILMLTARDAVDDGVAGLDAGPSTRVRRP